MTGTNTSTSTTKTITVNVNVVQEPATVRLANQTVCENSAVTLAATVSEGTMDHLDTKRNFHNRFDKQHFKVLHLRLEIQIHIELVDYSNADCLSCSFLMKGTVSGISCSSIENDTICLNSSVILNNSNTNTYTAFHGQQLPDLVMQTVLLPLYTYLFW